jgi:hypothetical protein
MWFRLAVNDDLITDEKKQKIINSVIEKVVLKQNGIEIISVWGSDIFHNSCNSQNDYTNYTTNNSTVISIKDQFFLPTNEITKEEFKVRFSQFTNEDVKSIKNMYYEQFKQIDEICNETGLSEETVISIITLKDMERMPKYEPKLKRERDFPLIYDLHFNKEISLKEIYKRYGFSPEYSRRVLKEHGYKPVHRGKLKKGQNSHSGQAL